MKFLRKNKVEMVEDEDQETKEHKYELFPDLLNNFTKKRQVTSRDIQAMSFIMARFLSMCSEGFDAAATYNDLSCKIPDWSRRPLLFHLTPKMGKPPYIKYTKKESDSLDPKTEAAIVKLCEFFSCKRHHGLEIYTLLKAQGQSPEKFFGLEEKKTRGKKK